jgi:alkylation response protein AidB-like acyl-CoA dehydrogenase
MTYTPPTAEQLFILNNVLGAGIDDAAPVLEAAGQLAAETFAPLNYSGNKEGAKLVNGAVVTASGFKQAYRAYVDGGWNGLPADETHGGQGLPKALAMAVQELWQASNIGLALCCLLNQGAVELLSAHGTPEQKQKYLGKLISGEFTGTMNLTEPQAGSDVGAVRTRAAKQADGTYRIFGQKIYISYGDHDFTDNIIHFVLARIDGAPAGTKGLSLFLVPKVMDDGKANDVRCVSLEHKLGQHGSPTCVMAYGDTTGAVGELVGAEGGGIAGMFTMMNDARLGVGIQGVALCDRAYQQALAFAKDRQQGGQPIINYPDVRRMLLAMKSQTEAARALAYSATHAYDTGDTKRVDLLTPIVKAWCTDLANELTSVGVQVHGGMGYIEETGAAQHMRDARVLAIYEGTNGIQANDLLFRKVLKDGGAEATRYLDDIAAAAQALQAIDNEDATVIGTSVVEAVQLVRAATQYLLEEKDQNRQLAAAAPYLRLFALTAAGGMQARMVQAALADASLHTTFVAGKLTSARFFVRHVLSETLGLAIAVRHTRAVVNCAVEQL